MYLSSLIFIVKFLFHAHVCHSNRKFETFQDKFQTNKTCLTRNSLSRRLIIASMLQQLFGVHN